MPFVTVTPNAAIDMTYELGRLAPGGINRVARVSPQPGGKGNNVARVLATLGHRPTATGFAGGHTGKILTDGLQAQHVEPRFVAIAGETRTCLTILEDETGRVTEIREPGAPLTGNDADRLVAHLSDLVQADDTVVVSGSLPPGLSPDVAGRLIEAARQAGAFVAFDASGDVLRAGVRAQPNLIKPNQEELAELIGPIGPDQISAVQRHLIGSTLDDDALVLLSLGADGAILIGKDRSVRASPPPITPKNTVGCGDALLAGFLDARANGLDEPAALVHAVAVGTASALQEAVGVVEIADVQRIRPGIRIAVKLHGQDNGASTGLETTNPLVAAGQTVTEGVFG